ncbi:putative Ig domain-containing protein [Comamonas piscis]|uniref:Putative Ig domain-containing protein n=1 Tax=Comamonas piscis TaxID=1562974 RepID=A0A7G5EMK6_9BURK|nr:Ig domain-containing protein [Comamonas piscis]QMV75231.1 putative Ig domain-containing protein [Comamonas piscis]WSO33722.1 Ig domain-containing protein [Comamonas piscis]
MRNLLKPLVLVAPLLLAACGGGGGSGGESQLQYSIKLTAAKTTVPVNVAASLPGYGNGDYYPYMSTLYIQANAGGSPIPNQADGAFSCNITSGLDSGGLYYLDGDDAHTQDVTINGETVKVPGSYRSITLGSNAGGASFHIISHDIAGEVAVQCSVTDPRDSKVYTDRATIKVGGGSTATPATVTLTKQTAYVGSRDNLNNIPNSVVVQAILKNDNDQPVSSAGNANLQVSIVPNAASDGAKLLANGQTNGGSMQINTVNGVGQFSVASGPASGSLLLRLTVDRADNDVSNGIQDPITQYAVIPVVHAIASTPLSIPESELAQTVQNAEPYVHALIAEGGVAPFLWSTTSILPTGLRLSSDGLISGTPNVKGPGQYTVVLNVRDANGATTRQTLVLTIVGNLPDNPVAFTINGCTGSSASPCEIASMDVGTSYTYSFSATGDNVTWVLEGAPAWMQLVGQGSTGRVASGSPLTCAQVATYRMFVTAKNSANSVTREVTFRITDTEDTCTPATPTTPETTP